MTSPTALGLTAKQVADAVRRKIGLSPADRDSVGNEIDVRAAA
jgi:hypothetical protein